MAEARIGGSGDGWTEVPAGRGLSAVPSEFPDPVRRGRSMTVWVIADAQGREAGRVVGSSVGSPEEAVARHLERVAEQAARAAPPAAPREAWAPGRPPRAAPTRPQLLHHFTSAAGLVGILGADRIEARSTHIVGGRTTWGASLTRDRHFSFDVSKPFRLSLDLDRLPRRPRTIPVRDAYMANQHKAEQDEWASNNEAEEFHPGHLRRVRDALVELGVRIDLVGNPELLPEEAEAIREAFAKAVGGLPDGVRVVAIDRRLPFRERERVVSAEAMLDTLDAALSGPRPPR